MIVFDLFDERGVFNANPDAPALARMTPDECAAWERVRAAAETVAIDEAAKLDADSRLADAVREQQDANSALQATMPWSVADRERIARAEWLANRG